MDLVKILNEAILRLPNGDYSPGLAAIMRHISIAIKHFERQEDDIDSFTDSVYRTNQAYEGSLKEAYRVLAEKDPMGMTPNQIEQYLEKNNSIRPRVLIQLSRYRQDYRNPSTHDYKLDFDQNEAILAIVSVCAFAKLLIDQISERLAFNAAASMPQNGIIIGDLSDPAFFIEVITKSTLVFLNSQPHDTSSHKLEAGIAGSLSALGLQPDLEVLADHLSEPHYNWDLAIRYGSLVFPMETRNVGKEFDASEPHGANYLISGVEHFKYPAGMIVLFNKNTSVYKLYKITTNSSVLFVVTKYYKDNVESIIVPDKISVEQIVY